MEPGLFSQYIVSGLRATLLGNRGSISFSTASRPALGTTQLPVQLGTESCFPPVKRSDREAEHSSSLSAELRMRGARPRHSSGG
jgi:hypothetical protein